MLTTTVFLLFSVKMNGHQPLVFFTLNKFIPDFLDKLLIHDDFAPRGIFLKFKVKEPIFYGLVIILKQNGMRIKTIQIIHFHYNIFNLPI